MFVFTGLTWESTSYLRVSQNTQRAADFQDSEVFLIPVNFHFFFSSVIYSWQHSRCALGHVWLDSTWSKARSAWICKLVLLDFPGRGTATNTLSSSPLLPLVLCGVLQALKWKASTHDAVTTSAETQARQPMLHLTWLLAKAIQHH